MTLNSDKVLRVGVIHNGKILDEQVFRKPETIFVGDSEKSHFVIPSSSLPSRFPIFYFKSGRYELVIMENMTGKVFLKGKVIEIDDVIKKGMLKKRGNAYILPLSQDSRGKVMVGSAIVLFQFITPPPKAPKLKLPRSIRGSWTQRIDWPFVSIESILAIIGILFFGVYIPEVPAPAPTDLSDIPNRFAKLIAPELDKFEDTKEEEKKVLEDKDIKSENGGVGAKREEKVDSNMKRSNKPRDAATIQKEESIRVAEMQKKVAGKGLLRMIGTMGEGGEGGIISDVLGDGAKDSDIDTALSGVKQIGIATNSSQRSRKGDIGATETAKIENLDVKKSDGKIGIKGRSEKAVVGRASVGSTEVDGQIDTASVAQIVKSNASAVKRCYDKGLLANPTLKGKVAVSIMINGSGRVEVVDITENTIGDASVIQCIKGVIMRLRFPKPDGGAVSVDSSFIFSPSN